jgi:RNA-directed DNA polymerase
MPSRFGRALRKIAQWCRVHRHLSVAEQHQALSLKLRGHYGYFGITGDFEALRRFRDAVRRLWQRWLSRRSGDDRNLDWDHFARLLQWYPLPAPRVVHSAYRS